MENEINVEPQEIIDDLLRQLSHMTMQATQISIVNRKLAEELNKLKELGNENKQDVVEQ